MVYINSRGEVVDDTSGTPVNILWRLFMFFVLFFKTLIGFEDSQKRGNGSGHSSRPSDGFNNGGGGGSGGSGGNFHRRTFGPRGFKSITDFPPPPPPCAGGSCG